MLLVLTQLLDPGSSDEVLDRSDGSTLDESQAIRGLGEKGASPQQRSNTTVHVCWHRATSVSANDYSLAVQVRGPSLYLYMWCYTCISVHLIPCADALLISLEVMINSALIVFLAVLFSDLKSVLSCF